LWWQWEQASHGRRQLTWSQGLRERYGFVAEHTLEEIAAEDLASDDLIALPAETCERVRWEAESLISAGDCRPEQHRSAPQSDLSSPTGRAIPHDRFG
jgi:hypothetical protein